MKDNKFFKSVRYNHENTIKSNLIVVPHGIFDQWLQYINEHTNLSVYAIERRSKIEKIENVPVFRVQEK